MARNTVVKASIIADAKSFVQGVRQATAATDRFGKATRRRGADPFAGMARSALRAAAATASLYGAYDQGRKAVNETKDLAKSTIQLTRTTGLSTQEASRFAAVTKVRGIEMTKLAASFTIFSKQIVAAQDGSEKASQAFQRLGVSQAALQRGNTKELFLQAADGLSKMENGARKTALAAQVFGRGYQALFPLLDMGAKGIAEQLQLAGDLGAELSGNSVEAFKKFAAAERESKLAIMGFRIQVGTFLIPILTDAIGIFQGWVKEFKQGRGPIAGVKDAVVGLYEAIKPLATFLINHPKLVMGAIAAYLAFKGAILSLNLYNALMTALGPVSLYGASGKARGLVFGINFGAAMSIGAMIGIVALPVIVATALERVGAVFQQWATRNMGPELKRLLGVPLTLNPLESFGPWFNDLKAMASRTWGAVKRIFSTNPLAANPFGRMSQWWDGIKRAAKGTWDFIKKLFGGGGGSSNLFGTIRAPKIEGLGEIASAVRGAIGAALRAIGTFAGRFLAAGKKVVDNLADGVRSAARGVISAASSVLGKALSSARGLIPGFRSVGASISNGLAAGIAGSIGNIISAAVRAVDEAQKAARRKAESKSPSQLFARIGEDLVAGMAQGMGRVQPVTRAAKNLIANAAGVVSTQPPRRGLGDFLPDPFTGQDGLDPRLVQQQERAARAQANLDRALKAAKTKKSPGGKKTTKGEKSFIDSIRTDLREAERAVADFEQQIARRDALLGIKDQFKTFADQAADTFREVKDKASQAALDTANSIAAGIRDSALARLDEATGDSPEAQRLRAIRAESERLAREREDKSYTDTKAQLEADLARATLNGNVRKQAELNAQLLELEQQRSDTLRSREEAELSASLQRQRDAAQSAYDAKTAENERAFNEAIARNAAETEDFRTNLNAQLASELDTLLKRETGYRQFAERVKNILAAAGIADSFGSTGDESAIQLPNSFPAKGGDKKGGGNKGGGNKNKNKKGKVSGGRLTPGMLTLVGETGPEMVVDGMVNSASRTNRLGGGAGVTLNVYPRTTADDPDALARALGWQLATR